MRASLRKAAGSLLVVGLGEPELTGLERAWLRLVRPGGIILFKRNIADAAQTRALLDEATGLGALHAARCVDVEGGAVNRLRDALAPLPSAQAVSEAALKLQMPALAREHGELIARAVKAFGFNTTLAPVLDLGLPQAGPVLGSRTAGTNAAQVLEYAGPFLEGLAAQGVVGCGKHFPGLGGAGGDTHFITAQIERTFADIWREDLAPYRALCAKLPMVMINHAAYAATRSGGRPASASRFWMTTVLRRRLGYRGILFSDDLEMGGILKSLSMEEAVVEAIRAGAGLLEICHSAELILRGFEALLAEAERSAAFRKLLLRRAAEMERKRKRMYSAEVPRALTAKQFEALRQRMLRFHDRIAAMQTGADSSRTASPAEIA
ncbi:MAG: beta-N-acetylhexosaminidase [Acidobacteriota bacterium]